MGASNLHKVNASNFFSYIESIFYEGFKLKTEIKENTSDSLMSANFPSSISSTPFVWDYYNVKYDMNFFSGFCDFEMINDFIVKPKKNFFIGHTRK